MSLTFSDRQADQLLKPGGHLVQPERRIRDGVAGGAAEVADQNQQPPQSRIVVKVWQRTLDPAVVGDAAVGRLRDVEIDADQDFFSGHVDVAERLFGHG